MVSTTTAGSALRFDVLGIGCTAVDERLYVSQFPAADGKVRILRREQSLGGLTAIALVAAARMGARVAFAGRLGPDELSQFVEHSLQKYGVSTDHVVRHPDARPGRSTILIDESAGTRAVLSECLGLRGADEHLPTEELVRQSRVLYVDGHGLLGSIRTARIARGAGRFVVADFERSHDGDFETLLGLVDHLIIPATFAAALTDRAGPAIAAAALLERTRLEDTGGAANASAAATLLERTRLEDIGGAANASAAMTAAARTGLVDPSGSAANSVATPCATVVVTCGRQGGVYCELGCGSMRYPAFRVPERDTTGCGDVFHGVYAAGLAFGWDTATRIRYAAAAAALKAASGGGPDAIPDRNRVEKFLKLERG